MSNNIVERLNLAILTGGLGMIVAICGIHALGAVLRAM